MSAIRKKSLRLADLFIARTAETPAFELLTPHDPGRRGSQVAFAHPHGDAIMQALIERGVIGDFRAPDVLRFGLAPLYVRFVDVWDTAAALGEVMRGGARRDDRFQRPRQVT
jgi:kynureninase